jgi:putative toxin-antitoxin system antitoxin component (TIGR02293 family)
MDNNPKMEDPVPYITKRDPEEPDYRDLIEKTRDGISFDLFSDVVRDSPFDNDQWCRFLHLSERTLHRYRTGKKTFMPPQSERIMEIALLVGKGSKVFGSRSFFDQWLFSKSIALGGVTPVSLLDNTFGITLVGDELGRIEHGILS